MSGALGRLRAGSTRVPPRHVLVVFWAPQGPLGPLVRLGGQSSVPLHLYCMPAVCWLVLRVSHKDRISYPRSVAMLPGDADSNSQAAPGVTRQSNHPSPHRIRGRHTLSTLERRMSAMEEAREVLPQCNLTKEYQCVIEMYRSHPSAHGQHYSGAAQRDPRTCRLF